MTIVKSSFYSMMMHKWTLLLEDSHRKKEKIYGKKVGVVVAKVVNDSNIQYLNPDDDVEEGGGKLTAPVSIHHYFSLYIQAEPCVCE